MTKDPSRELAKFYFACREDILYADAMNSIMRARMGNNPPPPPPTVTPKPVREIQTRKDKPKGATFAYEHWRVGVRTAINVARVMELRAEGKTYKEIAACFGFTTTAPIARIMRKVKANPTALRPVDAIGTLKWQDNSL